ncbi:DNA-binding transcriptional regulator CytR [Bowmanella denitrificans]|uniref:DNA-binding transcriptional regulator CytR n=1 Tax=Bowmanella denitrificans TaxID=366582 RepID=A0ABN0XQG4_9ALTE
MSKLGIKDIAARSGVSPATVSRTLRNPELVNKDTRKKVMKAVRESGYTPNRFGSSLRTQQSGNIVVMMPDITNQVNAGIIRAIEVEAQKTGYSVLLGDTQGQEARERHYAQMVSSGQADGILLYTHRLPFDLDNLTANLPPLVNGNESIEVEGLNKVMVDNVQGAKDGVNHLVALGHRRIAAVLGDNNAPSNRERLQGFQQALQQAGIEPDEQYLVQGDYTTESGMKAMEALLKLRKRPTAVFCFNDDMAIGAMSVLREYGYAIPGDISIMGFDDIRYASLMNPPLTTIHQPLEEIGQASMRLLLAQLSGKNSAPQHIQLPLQLVVRQSTGPAPESD